MASRELYRAFQSIIAIAVQESNLDNHMVRPDPDSWLDSLKVILTGNSSEELKRLQLFGKAAKYLVDRISPEGAEENRKYNRQHGIQANVPNWKKEMEAATLCQQLPKGEASISSRIDSCRSEKPRRAQKSLPQNRHCSSQCASKAFNPEYVDFFIAPITSGLAGDRSRFTCQFLENVERYRTEIWPPVSYVDEH